MEIHPSEIKQIDLCPTKWLEKLIEISKEELELSKYSLDNKVIVTISHTYIPDDDRSNLIKEFDVDIDVNSYDDFDDSSDDYYDTFDDSENYDDVNDVYAYEADDYHPSTIRRKEREARWDLRMMRMAPLFASQPRLEKISKDYKNTFVSSCFTSFEFCTYKSDSVIEIHEKADDLKYLLNLCGVNLTCLDVREYPFSQIMPVINANCPNLEDLTAGFKEIMSEHFKNVFSNMPHLKDLSILWECKDSTLPVTLVESLEQIGGTLQSLQLTCTLQKYDIFSPDILASVFPQLIALKRLEMNGFGLSQLLLQSIGKMKNLANLSLRSRWPKNHPMFDTKISMHPIGYLKNLENLNIESNYGVTDEFLINLCNNAKKLTHLLIIGKHITDTGMMAINDLEQLECFDLGLTLNGPRSTKNEFITDESIQSLFNQKLKTLDISHCIRITDESVIKLVKNLPNLTSLYVEKTRITGQAIREIRELARLNSKSIHVKYTTKERN